MGPTTTQRISYVPLEQMDERMKAEMARCAHSAPRARDPPPEVRRDHRPRVRVGQVGRDMLRTRRTAATGDVHDLRLERDRGDQRGTDTRGCSGDPHQHPLERPHDVTAARRPVVTPGPLGIQTYIE